MALPRIEAITNRCIQQGWGLSNDVQEAVNWLGSLRKNQVVSSSGNREISDRPARGSGTKESRSVRQSSDHGRADWVELEFHGGGDAEVPAAAAKAPEQIAIVGFVGRDQMPSAVTTWPTSGCRSQDRFCDVPSRNPYRV
jgi:hypothetical protein